MPPAVGAARGPLRWLNLTGANPGDLNGYPFAVNILSKGQGHLPRAFAKPGSEKFVGVDYTLDAGLPVLEDVSAYLLCSIVDILDGGDHYIVVGRVESFKRHDREPLIFHRGKVVDMAPATGPR
ncbi:MULTISPECIES: flavin reductase family protein [Glutamicibacter]|uniref:flavin reductase family protein n=1 Tax=Glutamicibacter TaxID=1742989 RepID=UPI00167F7B52|nr:flavin reductase family protein [Glutamicibacter nicotianae]